jgi:hypothetical protein
MARRRGTIKVVQAGLRTMTGLDFPGAPNKTTVATNLGKFSDGFARNWGDLGLGSGQHLNRVRDRVAMGQKKTPIGRTTLKRER